MSSPELSGPVAGAGAQPWWHAVRWRIAFLLCLVTTLNYIDRNALGIAAPVMLPELGLSTTQYGLIVSAFLISYALGQVLSGRFIDRIGTKRAFSWAVVVWNIASAGHALTQGFASLLGMRVVLGLGEAANFPAAVKAIAEWFPARERSLATGILTMGPGLGSILTPPLIGWLIIAFGWRWAFVISGALGLAWLVLWHRVYHPPEQHPGLTPAERLLITEGRTTAPPRSARVIPWGDLLRRKEVWGLMLSRFTGDGAFYFFVSFLPLYLSQQRGFDLKAIAFSAALPFVMADLGSLAGGYAGKRLIDRGWSVNASRKAVIWTGALLIPIGLPAVFVDSAVLALFLMSLALFFIQVKS
ncbi:MAG TPA: MFS transporter, partial [Steroidobacteraceae bacterium]|nr:MFS transporter [Steroidobacteraceae bacterium]